MDNQDNLFDTIDSDESSYASLSGERDDGMDIYSPFDVDAEAWSNDPNKWGEFVGQINRLPASSQDILFDANTAYFIKDIALNYELNEDQIKNLSRIVRDTLLGDLALEEMDSNIANKLNVPSDKASDIASLINSELFKSQASANPAPSRVLPPIPPTAQSKPDLKIEPDINRNNVVDLRNK